MQLFFLRMQPFPRRVQLLFVQVQLHPLWKRLFFLRIQSFLRRMRLLFPWMQLFFLRMQPFPRRVQLLFVQVQLHLLWMRLLFLWMQLFFVQAQLSLNAHHKQRCFNYNDFHPRLVNGPRCDGTDSKSKPCLQNRIDLLSTGGAIADSPRRKPWVKRTQSAKPQQGR